jgi:U3 small nucleolar ribonucleoprotein component
VYCWSSYYTTPFQKKTLRGEKGEQEEKEKAKDEESDEEDEDEEKEKRKRTISFGSVTNIAL